MRTEIIKRKLGCPITKREDNRVLVRHEGVDHWITVNNYNALARRDCIIDTLGHDKPIVKASSYVTFKQEQEETP